MHGKQIASHQPALDISISIAAQKVGGAGSSPDRRNSLDRNKTSCNKLSASSNDHQFLTAKCGPSELQLMKPLQRHAWNNMRISSSRSWDTLNRMRSC